MKQVEYGWFEEQFLLSPEVIASFGVLGFQFVGLFDISSLHRAPFKWLYLYARPSEDDVPVYGDDGSSIRTDARSAAAVNAAALMAKLTTSKTPPVIPEEPKIAPAQNQALLDHYRYYLDTFSRVSQGQSDVSPPADFDVNDAAATRAIAIADGLTTKRSGGLPSTWLFFEKAWNQRRSTAVQLRSTEPAVPDVIGERPRIPKLDAVDVARDPPADDDPQF